MEREFILRRFNKDFLQMEVSSGSIFNRIMGVGERLNKETGKMEKVVEAYPSIFRNVLKAFEIFPITKYFGLTPRDAMALPFDEWQEIVITGKRLAEHDVNQPSVEDKLLELIKGITIGRGEGS